MYTGPMCAFCDAAKRLFKRNNANFKEIDIGNNLEVREEMIRRSNGRRTVPQIFIEDKHIGGYKNDVMHGQGTYTWANGDKYIGEYKD